MGIRVEALLHRSKFLGQSGCRVLLVALELIEDPASANVLFSSSLRRKKTT